MTPCLRSGLLALLSCRLLLTCGWSADALDDTSRPGFGSTWTQPHRVLKLRGPDRLQITNDYYAIEHDLSRGGAITSVQLKHGAGELLLAPVAAQIQDEHGVVFSELNDKRARLHRTTAGLATVLEVKSRLVNAQGVACPNVTLHTTYEHHWGYVKIRKEFRMPSGFSARAITPFQATFAPGLNHYGFREGVTEQDGAPAFAFGSCRWGELTSASPLAVQTNLLPRYVMCAEPGVQGVEWFVGSDLHQWDWQTTGKRGQGECVLRYNTESPGIQLTVSALKSSKPLTVQASRLVFDYYLAVPLKEGHALKPWLHTSFNRNRGQWVSPEQIKNWAASGIQTVHCHNDGDYFDDGLFWRDGSYPPYPDMERYDKVLSGCRAAGIRTATYFSNKELHPSTREFQERGQTWGRKNLKGALQHNIFRGTNEFGVQMCLRSGWLPFLKASMERVLRNHPLDGVYYDWNVALLCHNPLHELKGTNLVTAAHWDIDELLELMEWTRFRVGPRGLVIIHNTTTPMFATENFADDVVANEWGYSKWSGEGPELNELPLEWSLVGARSRGVISYGQLDDNSPRRLHRVFALQALMSGVTPWPASQETFELYPVLKPIGELERCRFLDWRNDALKVDGKRCASAVYSKPSEAWLLLANMSPSKQTIRCRLDPSKLPYPLPSLHSITVEARSGSEADFERSDMNPEALVQGRTQVTLAGDSVLLLKLK